MALHLNNLLLILLVKISILSINCHLIDGFESFKDESIDYASTWLDGDDLSNDTYRIGFGIADITGPAAEINMMGYAKLGQDTQGIHLRLHSRAMILQDRKGKRICYVNVDLCGSAQLIKLLTIERLAKLYGPKVYRHENVMISATHTHSGPGGYFQYLLYIITQEGYIKESTDAIVDGVVKSIQMAHRNMTEGYIYHTQGTLMDVSVNRSPASYLENPQDERSQHQYDTDKTFELLKFTNKNGEPIGMVNWFAVHGVSMNNSNKLISSDNKGYAAITFEEDFNGHVNVGKGPFVAIFGQSNEGDSSPNIKGARCLDTGEPCDFVHSTCNGKNELCVAFGPGRNMFESTKIIGEKQYLKAKELFAKANEKITGDIEYIYQNINMSRRHVTLDSGREIHTCKAALGYAFAAGTTDGEGASIFHQGTKDGHESKIWDFVRDMVLKPSHELLECQKPKPVLLPVGELHFPYAWTPELMPTQIMEIGNLVIVGLPGEFTTMSGRRIRRDIQKVYEDHGRKDVHVILAGLANTYSNYVTTYEEYQLQRYEGGSTLFGPHTLQAYRQQYKYLAKNLVNREPVSTGPEFPNLLSKEITFKPGVVYDSPYHGHFGKVTLDPHESYYPGERVTVKFSSANPRNNLRLDDTFLRVERKVSDDQWITVATDANWETIFIWNRISLILGTSEATVLWDIPINTKPGIYRIKYYGDSRNIVGRITEFTGTSPEFRIFGHKFFWWI